MKLTEQYDGTCCDSGRRLSKLKLGTKENGLTYSVELHQNPESCIVRRKAERFTIFVHFKATVTGSQSIQTCSV